jgi:hypothetical protein
MDLLVDFLLVFLALVALVVEALLEAVFVAGAGVVDCAIRETPANARVMVAPRIAEIVFFIWCFVLCPKRFIFFASDSIDDAIMNRA